MGAHFQPGSMSADLMVRTVMQERARQARARQRASLVTRGPAVRRSLPDLMPRRLLSMVAMVLHGPARLGRQMADA